MRPGTSLFLVIVAVGIGTIALAYGLRRKPGVPELTAEHYATLGDAAADAEDHPRAAQMYARARERSPKSRRLAIDHAFCLSRSGDIAGAMEILEDPLVRDDQDAVLLLARLHIQQGDLASAETVFLRGLHRTPTLVSDVEGDPLFDTLLARRPVAEAARKARRKLP
ncbi:MAG TPA: tetratricopeptide repeat protein [Candidatus Thermoplasmatota archaeon]|nr:tetratricopeptide repeat protein [Candidatus Thermoplasmatota archaeon]